MSFREDFFWGVASSSYQVEGASKEDGKGANIWDVYTQEKGNKVYQNQTGEMGCDFYHRYKEDIALMKELGVNAYRFSINWARILPNGIGEINEKGIDFYNRIIDELLEAGIEPFITLFHWDYPYALHQKGGWLNEESPDWFAEYAALIAERFSDRVTKYFTINEPQCFIGLGYCKGKMAPGYQCMLRDQFQMTHNTLKAHGKAVIALREHAKQKIQVGFAPTGQMSYPDSHKPEDIEAARQHLFQCPTDLDNWFWNLAWWMDPVLLGHYPEDGLQLYHDYLPEITKEDLELIHQPLDFLGQNIYNGHAIKMGKNEKPEVVERYEGFPKTSVDWPVTYECLYWGPKFLADRYGNLPLYITENGMACHDTISLDGSVHDPNRIDFLHRYLKKLKEASEDGVDVRGYFHWAFTDNFEWSQGYNERFGLVYIDYQNQKRVPKDSYHWYQSIIKGNGANL